MRYKLRVTLIANAGLLMEYKDTAILIDAVYGDQPHPFSNPSRECRNKMLHGDEPFTKIDYILVTHSHPDHYSAGMLKQYLEAQNIKGAFLSAADTPEEHALESYMGMRGIPLVSLEKDAVHYQYHVEKNIMLHAFMTRHLDKRFYHIPHFCYLLTFEEEHFLFTADVDYPTETFSNLDGKILRSVFLNPMFFHSVFDAAHFRGQLNFQSICVYHIPFETDDRMALRKMVFRDILSRPSNENKTIALSEPFQRIEFA